MMRLRIRSYLLGAVSLLLLVYAACLLVGTVLARGSITESIAAIETEVQSLSLQYAKNKSVKEIQNENNRIQNLINDISVVVSFGFPASAYLATDPVKFKDELLQFELQLRDEAVAAGIFLPDDVGFNKYREVIATEEVLKDLLVRKQIITDILGAIFSSRIRHVKNIGFSKTGTDNPVMELDFVCNQPELIEFLVDLENISNPYIVTGFQAHRILFAENQAQNLSRGSLNVQISIALLRKIHQKDAGQA